MTQNFAFPVVGWLRDLSAGARQEIGRRFPTLPADRISSEAGWYVIMRDANHPAPDERTSDERHQELLRWGA